MHEKCAILLDVVDYLYSKYEFREILSFVQRLREISYVRGHTVIMAVDPSILNKRETIFLEKETREIESIHAKKLSRKALEVLKFVFSQNIKAVKPSYTDIERKLGITKPTVRKRIGSFVGSGYLQETKKKTAKYVELTEKGKRFFNRDSF